MQKKLGVLIFPISTKDKSRLHQFGAKILPGIIIGYALNSGGGWTRDLIIANWHDIENNGASEVYVKRFQSKEVGIYNLKEVFVFPAADGSLRQDGRTQRQILRLQRVESSDAGEVPSTVGDARSNPLQCARGESLHEEGRRCGNF